jgi:hypothetical protein
MPEGAHTPGAHTWELIHSKEIGLCLLLPSSDVRGGALVSIFHGGGGEERALAFWGAHPELPPLATLPGKSSGVASKIIDN